MLSVITSQDEKGNFSWNKFESFFLNLNHFKIVKFVKCKSKPRKFIRIHIVLRETACSFKSGAHSPLLLVKKISYFRGFQTYVVVDLGSTLTILLFFFMEFFTRIMPNNRFLLGLTTDSLWEIPNPSTGLKSHG